VAENRTFGAFTLEKYAHFVTRWDDNGAMDEALE
jgi:hypothetical protein